MTLNKFDNAIEKIAVSVFPNRDKGSVFVASQIASIIRENNEKGKRTVLGLATGSSPLVIYKELIRLHKEEGLSFENVVSFNLDEYYSLPKDNKQSYNYFMEENLFKHIDIKHENVFIPDGMIEEGDIEAFCEDYECKIQSFGGLDVQLLGIGRTGHIGFNEPGSSSTSITRLVNLHEVTREDATSDFGSCNDVPSRAITMGVKTILGAKKIYLVAWGEAKADILQHAVEGEIDEAIPASYLQMHNNVTIITNTGGASKLARAKTPWLLGECYWDALMEKRAVVWLAKKVEKPILKLTDSDYKEHGLNQLLKVKESAYKLNIHIYNQIQQTITGWPGGKPNADDKVRPERTEPYPKTSIIFSPHPDDDVISMGGTLLRLVEQGHNVHVAYQTSGNIAVFDDEVIRFTDFAVGFAEKFNMSKEQAKKISREVREHIATKDENDNSNRAVLDVKGLIRQGEASAACRYCGVDEENIHFLEMPFYETASIVKNPLGDNDINIIINLLRQIKPHQIFAAGDLQDPHGTHAVCLQAIFKALEQVKDEPWFKDCYIWLYRGAWQEWDVEDIEMAVPISPEELFKKRKAIFKHQSQKDYPLFQGEDKREFWQRAEDRNRGTAKLYDELGLTEYEAIEAFKRYKPN